MAQEEWGKSVEELTDKEYQWIEDLMNDYGNDLTKDDKPNSTEGGPGSGRKGHQSWMRGAEEIDEISDEDMKRETFLARSEDLINKYTP